MTEPSLDSRWLMRLRGRIPEPVVVSPTLMVFNVLEAEIDSPRVKARLRSPSGDWVRILPNGNWKLDVRLLMETDDGAPIYIHYNGLLRMRPGLMERIAAGESIEGAELYFRSTPYFETAAEKYAWLNDLVAVGRIASFGGGEVVYDVFELM